MAAHASGDLHMVFGHWAHRLSPGLEVLASHRLPVDRPHNSFVVLDSGELVTKDCDAPAGGEPSTFSVLEPMSLLPVAAPLRLPEPCVGRLSSDGESVVAIGTTSMYRLRLDPDAERLVVDECWRPRYGLDPDRGFGWDPVITDEHVFWMDNGRNRVDHTMLGTGADSAPLRLWWARRDDGRVRSLEVTGLPYGTQSNPPGWDPETGTVIAYDSGNRGLAAWRLRGDELEPLWRRDRLAHAGHLILFTDTRELVAGDWKDSPVLRNRLLRPAARALGPLIGGSTAARKAALALGGDRLVVLDLDSGDEKARVEVPSPVQGFLFPAPGFERDVYYQSLTTIARVVVS